MDGGILGIPTFGHQAQSVVKACSETKTTTYSYVDHRHPLSLRNENSEISRNRYRKVRGESCTLYNTIMHGEANLDKRFG